MSNSVWLHGVHTSSKQVGNEKSPDWRGRFTGFTDFTLVREEVHVPGACVSAQVGVRASSATPSVDGGKSVKRGKSLYVKGCFHPTRCELPREIHGVSFEEVPA